MSSSESKSITNPSGIDTQLLIDAMKKTEQEKIDSLTEKVELEQAKIATFGDVQIQLESLAESVNVLKGDGTSGNTLWDNKTVSNGNTDAVNVIANSNTINATYSIDITQLAQPTTIYGDPKEAFTVSGGNKTFTLNDAVITVYDESTLTDVANAINNAAYAEGESISATIIDNRLVLMTEEGTEDGLGHDHKTINLSVDASSFMTTTLGVFSALGVNYKNSAATNSQAAELTINGVPVTSENNLIEDAATGINLELLSLTSGTSFNVTVDQDTESIKNALKDFIDVYNETRDMIQRIKEIKLDEDDRWGVFKTDNIISGMNFNLKTLVTSSVNLGNYDAWNDASVTVNTAASVGDNSVDITGLNEHDVVEDTFLTIDGDTQIYRVTTETNLDNTTQTVNIDPSLKQDLVSGEGVSTTFSLASIGIGIDTSSSLNGPLKIIDEAKLDTFLLTQPTFVRTLFAKHDTHNDPYNSTTPVWDNRYEGISRRLHIG